MAWLKVVFIGNVRVPLSKRIGKWIANTEATTTEHHIFTVKQNYKRNGQTVLHSHIIFHTLRCLCHISLWTQLFMLLLWPWIFSAPEVFSHPWWCRWSAKACILDFTFKQQFKTSLEQFHIFNYAAEGQHEQIILSQNYVVSRQY